MIIKKIYDLIIGIMLFTSGGCSLGGTVATILTGHKRQGW